MASRLRRLRSPEACFKIHGRHDFRKLRGSVECLKDILVLKLGLGRRIFEDAGASRFLVTRDILLDRFGLSKTMVEHPLIVVHQSLFRAETRLPVILRLAENVVFLLPSCTIGVITPRAVLRDMRILSQSVVKCSLLVSSQMLRAQSTAIPGDVHVTTTAVVRVNYRSGMQYWQLLLRPLFLNHKSA